MSELTAAERLAAANQRAAKVSRLKAEYQKIFSNPWRTNNAVFDPAVMRYEAARAYAKDFYKFTPRSMLFPVGMILATVVLQKMINSETNEKENSIRSGESTYYERAKYASRGLY